MVMLDTALLLVEGKAGRISSAARRGAPSLKEDLEALIGDAHGQALRALKYLETFPNAEFHTGDDHTVVVNRASFTRVNLMTSTLDSLTAFSTNLAALVRLGVMRSGEFPWAVNLLDLRVIAELTEFQTQLVHFLEHRVPLSSQPIEAHDELDFFGHYLTSGLNLDYELSSKPTRVEVSTHTANFDDYFLYQMGVRETPAPKPAQALPKGVRENILAIEAEGHHGFLDEVCMILDEWRATKAGP